MNNSCDTNVLNQCDPSVCVWNSNKNICERKICDDCDKIYKTDFCSKIKEVDTCYKYAICSIKKEKCVQYIY